MATSIMGCYDAILADSCHQVFILRSHALIDIGSFWFVHQKDETSQDNPATLKIQMMKLEIGVRGHYSRLEVGGHRYTAILSNTGPPGWMDRHC